MNKDIVLVETMFKYADIGINPVEVLTESAGTYIQSSVLLEVSGDAAGLFSKLNDGRKELMKKIENIDWKEWVKKMKETIGKIIRFITAPARTAVELATGRTTLKEVGQRLKQVWTNLRNKKNKTPEEKTAEKAVGEMANEIAKVEEKIEGKDTNEIVSKRAHNAQDVNAQDRMIAKVCDVLRDTVNTAFNRSSNSMYLEIVAGYDKLSEDRTSDKYKALQYYLEHYSGAMADITNKIGDHDSLVSNNIRNIINRISYVAYIEDDLNKMIAKTETECTKLSADGRNLNEIKGILNNLTNTVDLNCQDIIKVYNVLINKLNSIM